MALGAGIAITRLTKRPGDASKILEVKEAKERLRVEAQRKLYDAMRDVDAWASLNGIGFERAVAIIYREQGFNVEFTPRTNDQGVDLILRKDGTVSIVQCKAYAKSVGVSAVRELVGTRAAWPNPTEAILVALFDFSGAAKAFAAEHNVKLYSVAREYLKTDYRPGS
jgi:restriction system protein